MSSSLLSPIHDILPSLEASFIYDQVEAMMKIYGSDHDHFWT
jgi:hypothetical protein